ncbi:MAG: type II toxin-antitoxin system HicB family antitoxin [Chloroflexi bacterium]|nr:type II toxin-antitoxin system HicB family antitoxin [Chloroflexota bacterium]
MKLTYVVVFERLPNNYGAYAPDVPGCVSVGDTWDEMQAMIREALTYHIEDLLEQGEPLPEPKRTIEEAIAYHSDALAEYDEHDLAEYGDDPPTLSTRFELVEVEVEVPAPRAARAG